VNKVILTSYIEVLESGGRPKGGVTDIGDIPSLGAEHLDDSGKIDFSKRKMVSDLFYSNLAKGKIELEDILIVKDGATTGKVAFVDSNFKFEKAAINEHVFRLRPKIEIWPKYLFYYLFSKDGKQSILKDFRGATVGGISKGFTNNIILPLPPLETQKKIAAILDKADELRQNDKKILEKYDQMVQSIFLEMFGDIDSNQKFPITSIGKIVTEVKDGPHVSPTYSKKGIPILSTRNIRPFELDLSDVKYVSEGTFKELTKRFKPQRNDVLLTKGGTTGFAKLVNWDWEFCIWVHIAALRPNMKLVYPRYLEAALNSYYCYRQSQKYTHGIANKDLGLKRLINIRFPIPPMKDQYRFSIIYESINQQKEISRQSLQKSEDLFQSLLQRAFTGELV
jgi:type I restriction enzyme, S subunit